jgi:glycine hydroxymethyltransferase
MTALARRHWVPSGCEDFVQHVARDVGDNAAEVIEARLGALIAENRQIHERDCLNLNPATNTMNPRAEAYLAAGLGTRPSLGYPGDKYEMGLEAIEQIEIIAAELCAEVFEACYAEIRVGSGAMANLYAFMAVCQPGDAIIVPSATIGGHVTHHDPGCAGLYGLRIYPAPLDPDNYTVDLAGLRELANQVRPKLITVGGSLNLFPHPVAQVRALADDVGAKVLFDAAHLCGMFAGRAWPNPLKQGAHMMTMSTYKSLGGPPSGLFLTQSAEIAQRVDSIAFPGMTANFDAAKSAALALTMLDWKIHGMDYAAAMRDTADALAKALQREGLPVFATSRGFTESHQLALEAARWGGGQSVAKSLRRANILASGIGLPREPVDGDMNGLRLGTPEIVRWGVTAEDMPQVASLIARVLVKGEPPERVAIDVSEFRRPFQTLRYIRES